MRWFAKMAARFMNWAEHEVGFSEWDKEMVF